MPESEIFLSVIIPARNEAERLPRTIRRMEEYLSGKPFAYELIVALDGPADDTPEVARRLAAEIRNVRILERRVHRGKGYTVREGMLNARGRIRLFSDADNSTDISHFDRMVPLFDGGRDVVIGSRHPGDARGAGQRVSQAWHKRLLGNLGNWLVRLLAVRGIRDTQCGFKAFRDRAAIEIFSASRIDGFGFDVEVLALARRLNFRIGVVPVSWVNDPRSHVTVKSYLAVLWEIVQVRWNAAMGRYERGRPRT